MNQTQRRIKRIALILQTAFDGLQQTEDNTKNEIRSNGTDEVQLRIHMEKLRVNLTEARERIIADCRKQNGDELTDAALALIN